MTILDILPRFWPSCQASRGPNLHLAGAELPRFVQDCPVARRYHHFFSPLDWARFPERNLQETRGTPAIPYRSFVAACCLVKLDQQLRYMADLHQYLCDHPALAWLLGFQTPALRKLSWRRRFQTPLPTPRHFTRMLRTVPNVALQFLLDETVRLLQAELS